MACLCVALRRHVEGLPRRIAKPTARTTTAITIRATTTASAVGKPLDTVVVGVLVDVDVLLVVVVVGAVEEVVVGGAGGSTFSVPIYCKKYLLFEVWPPPHYDSELCGLGATPNMLTVAIVVMRSRPAYELMTNLIFSFWYLAAVQQTILSISRSLFGMSFDRFLKTRLADVSEKLYSPVISLLAALGSIPFTATVVYADFISFFSTAATRMLFCVFVGINSIVYALGGKARPRGATVAAEAVTDAFFFALTLHLPFPFYTPLW